MRGSGSSTTWRTAGNLVAPLRKRRPDTDRRGVSFWHDELFFFGFWEQNRNENYKQNLAAYKEADATNYGSSKNEY